MEDRLPVPSVRVISVFLANVKDDLKTSKDKTPLLFFDRDRVFGSNIVTEITDIHTGDNEVTDFKGRMSE